MTLKNWGAVKKETVSGAGAEAVSGSWHKSKRSSQITGRAICSHARRGCSPRHGSTLLFLPCPLTQADNSNRRVQILDGADGRFLAKVCGVGGKGCQASGEPGTASLSKLPIGAGNGSTDIAHCTVQPVSLLALPAHGSPAPP